MTKFFSGNFNVSSKSDFLYENEVEIQGTIISKYIHNTIFCSRDLLLPFGNGNFIIAWKLFTGFSPIKNNVKGVSINNNIRRLFKLVKNASS